MSFLRKKVLNSYITHRDVLYKILSKTDGPVLECGSGFGSTPFLHELCASKRRELLTLESDRKWLDKFYFYKTDWHRLEAIESWEKAISRISEKNWDVVFVDQNPWEARHLTIKRIKNKARYIILHDCNYFPENNIFGKNLETLNGPKNIGKRDYKDEFKYSKEFFPVGVWPDRLKGPPTLLASNFSSCDIPASSYLEILPTSILCDTKDFFLRIFPQNTKA